MRRYSGVYVYYVRENDNAVYLKAVQKKNHADKYASQKEIADAVKSNFAEFTDKTIHVGVQLYKVAPVDVVNPEWVKKEMQRKSIRVKHIEADFGIGRAEISAMINGHKPIGQRSKAAFFYYFKSLGQSETDGQSVVRHYVEK